MIIPMKLTVDISSRCLMTWLTLFWMTSLGLVFAVSIPPHLRGSACTRRLLLV
eukprot:JZ549675.1.p3 GENE.JZ549675.1~~JZ549675.1.p3  ORF type:complete len:53 (+),score=0.06 JZ549675.1:133-291(+)